MPGQKIPEQERREQILNAAMRVALRGGIGAVTVRAVAAEAGLSHALVLFHFKRKETLVRALLASVLSIVLVAPEAADLSHVPTALERLQGLVRAEMERLRAEPGRVRLLLDSWALGAHHPALREEVTRAWAEYRGAFRAAVEGALTEAGQLAPGASVDGVAALAVAVISQCVVQGLIDPEGFPTADCVATSETAMAMLFGAAG